MRSETWRLLRTGPAGGPENMALDEVLASTGREPCLRLYGWDVSCLSLGRFQRLSPIFDLVACRREGVPLVRRPTGGRAILHQPQEVTYSIAAPPGHWLARKGVMESYRAINEALTLGLRSVGIDAQALPRSPSPGGPDLGIACFERAYRHEVFWRNKKIVASAQSRAGGALLQQGSLPLSLDGCLFARLVVASLGDQQSLARRLAEGTATPQDALGREVSFEEMAQGLVTGVGEAWGILFREENPTAEEEALAERLVQEKYSNIE